MTPMLLYHQVADVEAAHDPHRLAVTPRRFEQQMAYLHHGGYRCLSLAEALRYPRDGLLPPKKSFVITFDDGYQDLYATVWPILERFGFTATVFFVAGRAGCLSDWEGQRGAAAAPLLSWAQARELSSLGLTFGGHTLTHPRLTGLGDKQAMAEIRQAKEVMEDRLAGEVSFFSYPYHDYDARIQGLVAEAGYEAACGGRRGAWGRFNLWRVDCEREDSRLSFALKAAGRYHQYTWLREQTPVGRALVQTVRQLRGALKKGP